MDNNKLYKNQTVQIDFRPLIDSVVPLADAVGLGLWKWRVKENIVEYSLQLEQLLGYGKGELDFCGEVRFKLIHPKDIKAREELLQKLLVGEINDFGIEERGICKDGTSIWVHEHIAVTSREQSGFAIEVVAMVNDISKIKRSEERQQEEARHWESMAQMAGVAGWVWDIEKDYIQYNKEFEDLLGYAPQEINGSLESAGEMLPVDEMKKLVQTFRGFVYTGGEGKFSLEFSALAKNGVRIWLYCIANVVKRDKNGAPLVIRGGVINIDQRVRMEEKLRENLVEKEDFNRRLKYEVDSAVASLELARRTSTAMFEANPHVNLLFNDRYQIVDCNPEAISFFNFRDKDDFEKNFVDFLLQSIVRDNAQGKSVLSLIDYMKQTESKGTISTEVEVDFSGTIKYLHSVFKRIPYENSFAIVVYINDITDVRLLTAELEEQSELLSYINEAAANLLTSSLEQFDDTIYEAMEKVGLLLGGDRLFLWKNQDADGKMFCHQLYEWIANSKVPEKQGNNYNKSYNYESVPFFANMITNGFIVNSKIEDLPAEEQYILGKQNVLSVLIIPIVIQGKTWGFVGLDDCNRKRTFSKREEDSLRSAGSIFVSSLLRNQTTLHLVKAREEALASMNAKSEFLSRMSHEIRTPLNAIIGMTGIAQSITKIDDIQYCLEKIDKSSHQLLGILNGLLDASEIVENTFEIQCAEFDFENLMQDLLRSFHVKAKEKNLKLEYRSNYKITNMVNSDEPRIRQVISNFLDNAIKFTPVDGEIIIAVEITALNSSAASLQVFVVDNGIGLPEDKEGIYEMFEQADGGITRQYGGTGLGLAINKKIIDLMGGKMWAQDNPQGGASFCFEIKILWGRLLEANSAVLQEFYDWGEKHLLLVEDNELNQEIVVCILQQTNINIDIAKDGLEAVEFFTAQPGKYDLILMDIQMPRLDGLGATKKIRELDIPRAQTIPIVALTANAFKEDEEKCLKAGMNGHLAKPVDVEIIYRTISRYLE